MAASITIPIKGGKLVVKSKRDLGKASNTELVAAYNKLSSKKVKKFADKTTAAERLWELICEANPSMGKAKAAPKKGKSKSPRPQANGLNYPVNKPILEHREGTNRAKAIQLLSRKNGATVAEVEKATGWNTKQAREGIRILHSRLGYGIKEDDKGHVRLVG